MYNFELMENEEVIKIFDEIFIRQGENEKVTTIVLTDKRMLFLDHITPNEGLEVLRVARGANYIKYKDVYYEIDLNDVVSITNEDNYCIILKNEMSFEFSDDELYKLLQG